MDGFGNINWWGFSPSVDLLGLYSENNSRTDIEELNVLIACAGDQRHILNSLAFRKKLYARDFLLLSLAIEHPSRRGLQEKTELYLEIFGNLLIRDYTSQIIQTKSNEFIKYITDLEHMSRTNLNVFDFNLLKYKERDFLEGIFKFWRTKNQEAAKDYFPAQKCWEIRLRTHFGVRYDSRKNGFDWDFAMKLSDRKNVAVINNKVYSNWRETGVAFELRDSSYDTANKTLASGMVFSDPRTGDKTGRRGYFGDIIVGPFLSYGIKSDNKDFYKKQNEQFMHTGIDISRANVNELMQGILESSGIDLKKYKTEKTDSSVSSKLTGLKIEEIIEEENEDESNESTDKKTDEKEDEYLKFTDFKIVFLPLTAFADFTEKSKYDNFFDIVYFSNSGIANMTKSVDKILKNNALVIVETTKYMIEMKNEQINGFSERLRQIASECKLTDLTRYEKKEKVVKSSENENNQVKLETLDYLLFKKV